MSSDTPQSGSPKLHLIIRFSTSIPDQELTQDNLSTTSLATLKQQIRAQLPPSASKSRLRLIHSGRVLQDTVSLSQSLGAAAKPPPPPSSNPPSKTAGKLPLRDPAPRLYLHCSIGDTLSASDLATEQETSKTADTALLSTSSQTHPSPDEAPNAASTTTTTPAPRGFDRLLSTGFTPAEVSQLRSQFLAIQSHSHTPDTMPRGSELLDLEERWLDNGQSNSPGGQQDSGGFGAEDSGALEDMLYGNLAGFFWPVAAVCWLSREEGVWSQRRRVAVLSGFLVNLTFGFLRLAN
ncbi:hypothetical protein MBLNU230_g1244t1 [Neophaeotheca triangularis]